MKTKYRIVSYVFAFLFAILTSFYTRETSSNRHKQLNESETSTAKKYRVCIGISIGKICIGIEITSQQQGEEYVCNISEEYCTVTVDEANIHFDPETGQYYVLEQDIISYESGEFQEL